jgi:ribosomal protein S18 acetylase RimI-like enzyme
MTRLTVKEVPAKPRDIRSFLKFSYRIYTEDSPWVAPLIFDLQKVFTGENPLFEHAEMKLWMAYRDGEPVGRISGLIDRTYCTTFNEPAAFFGFFECINDPAVAGALFDAVSQWAAGKGMKKLIGPMNPTTNDECGLLVEGFEFSPAFMMPYNPAHYPALLERCRFTKANDLLAYFIDLKTIPIDRLARIGGKVKARNPELSFRPIRKKTLEADLGQVKQIYNEAWQENWGFVPMTDSEINFMAERMKPLLMEGLVWLVEKGEEPVGFLLALPDFNVPMKPLRGRLLTPQLFSFVAHVLGWKRPPGARVLTLGVKAGYRSRGLESAMLIEGLAVGIKAGFSVAEASWILEDNMAMGRVIEAIGGKVYKRYRIYERAVIGGAGRSSLPGLG